MNFVNYEFMLRTSDFLHMDDTDLHSQIRVNPSNLCHLRATICYEL
jgi:hypothetical protein